MRVLALYSNENGEAQQAVVNINSANGEPVSLTGDGPDIAVDVAAELPDYNSGGGLHLVELWEENSGRPDVCDQDGNEVPCSFVDVTLGA